MCVFAAPAVAGGLGGAGAGLFSAGAAGAASGLSFGAAAALPSLGAAAAIPTLALPAGFFTAGAASAIPLTTTFASSSFLGLGSAAKPFLLRQGLNLGTNLLTGIAQRRAANAQAQYAYEAARKGAIAADLAFQREVEATAARLKEERASAAQEKLTATIKGLKAKAAIRATERAGLTIDLLLQDAENQAANLREAISQTMESQTNQYSRDVQALEAKRDSRFNQQEDIQNQAYVNAQKAPTLLDTIAQTANQGLQDYTTLQALV